ncbi:single-stranded DNA exonuclease [Novimethylophilus kurashikiensis]|uniref:Single-stranded DNA exonuclease n=1 Tax=Novimethylophilus kurashikiensis TaxID=1825523 RepID=A0A2R5FBL2_9PROT|nr:CYTH and CHAD domain-containing protein [Novimethylophilus kurashikiensis]GBG14081.1 single-stranded DNA exonuclease [Novimethylophilus kurashikiensis]
MPNEVELKLRIARKDAARLRKHPAILAATVDKPVTRKLTSIYYDTPDLQLLDAEISLRVRRMSGGWFQAVKAAGSSLAGLHQRMEWEDIIASGQPDFTRILDPQLVRIFGDEALRAALAPIFRTEVQRTEWQLKFDNGDAVELALDLGHLVAGKKREPITEIELELKSGNAARLFDLALILQQDIPLSLENVSKAQRGYAHYRPQPPTVFKAKLPQLSRQEKASVAFRKIAWECITHLQGNQDVVLHGNDVEGVHQMRVSLRRLRSAFSVFRGLLGRETTDPIIEELRWITDILGAARDLDVFVTQTLPPLQERFEQHAGLVKLGEKAALLQTRAYRDVRAALNSQRYHRLLLSLAAWLENERWKTEGTLDPDVAALADATLANRHKQLRRHGKRLQEMPAEERHQTRIAAKKLRYTAEFFLSLYSGGKSHAFIHRLAQLQDRLGVLNDIAVTEQLLRRLAGSRPDKPVAEALLLFKGWNACNIEHSLAHMDEAWHRFVHHKPFWG